MRGVEHQFGTGLVGDFAHGGDRMLEQIETAADGDQRRLDLAGERGERRDVDRVAVGENRRLVNIDTVKARRAGAVVRDMPADAGRRHDDGVARFGRRHERIEVSERAGADADLGVFGLEYLGRQFGADHLDLLDRFQTHLVFITGIAE
jgi:hypothetical protein